MVILQKTKPKITKLKIPYILMYKSTSCISRYAF